MSPTAGGSSADWTGRSSFDTRNYSSRSRALNWLRFRYPVGPLISAINRDLLEAVSDYRPDVVWFDKPINFTVETIGAIKKTGAQVAFYVQDSPFGPRDDGCWMQFLKIYRMADLHCVLREADIPRYTAMGLPWIKIMLCFDPQVHFPPGNSEAERIRGVSYIGHPYEERPSFLLRLARDYHLPVNVNGHCDRWLRALTGEELKYFTLGDHLADAKYREGIWRSKINISFITKDNEEDIALKAVESAGCGGFLMAIRASGHQAILEEDHEAVFFSSVEECADKCRFYLGRPDLREGIAARGHERAVRCGYDDDTQLGRVLNRLDGKEV